MSDPSTSLSLLQRVRAQQPAAWDRLVYLYSPLVEHWCRLWGLQAADADDIRQEVFQAVARTVESFRHDRPGDTFRGWLRVITRRKFLDHCRRREQQTDSAGGSGAYQRLLQVPEPAETDDDPSEIRRLHRRALDLVRDEFEERTWQAFWAAAVDGYSPLDVARELAMTPAAVRKAKSRVLRRLKEELGEVLNLPNSP